MNPSFEQKALQPIGQCGVLELIGARGTTIQQSHRCHQEIIICMILTLSKGMQLKWQSARLACERYGDRYLASPIGLSQMIPFILTLGIKVIIFKQNSVYKTKVKSKPEIQMQDCDKDMTQVESIPTNRPTRSP